MSSDDSAPLGSLDASPCRRAPHDSSDSYSRATGLIRVALLIAKYRMAHLRRALGSLYEFESFLGRGAFASVLLARNRKLGRLEAVKILQESYDGDHELAKRFVAEAKLVASLDHPNIVKVYDYGEADGVLWYSMQYINGPTLKQELETHRQFSQKEIAALAVPLLDALAVSHAAGIVHRDVKPANILLDSGGRPYLTDFGIAKVNDGVLKTQTGSVLGTPGYISPEQASGLPVDGRSDLYSLSICLYQLLTGSLPFASSDPIRMLIMRTKSDPPPPSDLREGVDPRLEEVLMKALDRDPEQRFHDAGHMSRRLVDEFPQDLGGSSFQVTVTPKAPAPLKDLPEVSTDVSGSEAATQVSMSRLESLGEERTVVEPALAPQTRPSFAKWAAVAALGLFLLTVGLWFGGWFPGSRNAESEVADQAAGAPSQAETMEKQRSDASSGGTAELSGSAEGDSGLSASTDSISTDAQPDGSKTGASSAAPQASDQGPKPEGAAATAEPRSASNQKSRNRDRRAAVADPAPRAPMRRPVTPPSIAEQPAMQLDSETASQCGGEEVVLSVRVGESGAAKSSRVLVSNQARCAQFAQTHVNEYRFNPALDFKGQPVEAGLTLSIQFPEPPG